jgi:integrase
VRKRTTGKYAFDGIKLGRRGRDWVADYLENGRRIRSTLGRFRSEDEAKAALHKFVEAHKVLKRYTASYTIGQLWELWLANRAADGFSNKRYRYDWVALGPYFGDRMPENVFDDVCREYARRRFADGRAPYSVVTELLLIRACLHWAEKRQHITKAPYVWLPKRGTPRKVVITAEEARALLEAAVVPHIHLFIVLVLTTGARHSAMLELTWDRIDFEAGTIAYDDLVEIDPMSKSWRKGRATVPMNALSRAALELAYAGRQSKYVIEWGGRRIQSVRDGFEATVKRAGITKRVTPHTIRHSVATWLRERGVDLHRISQVLAHADMRTTNQIYTHTTPDYLRGAVQLIDDHISPAVRTGNIAKSGTSGQPRRGFARTRRVRAKGKSSLFTGR